MVERGKRGGEERTLREADARVDRGGDDGRQPGLFDDVEGTARAAERLRLDDDDVGRAGARDRQRILRLAHRLVGCDRQIPLAQPVAQLGELRDARAGLLGVLEVELGQRVQRALRLVDVPPRVGVDADAPLRPHLLAHGGDAGDVVVEGLAGLGHFHLRRAAGPVAGEHTGHVRGRDGGHGGVDADPRPMRRRLRLVGEVDRRREPRARLYRRVLEEGGELAPALGPLEQCGLAMIDTAEPGGERKRDDAER